MLLSSLLLKKTGMSLKNIKDCLSLCDGEISSINERLEIFHLYRQHIRWVERSEYDYHGKNGECSMVIIKATEKHLQGIMSLCKDCSQNMINNLIDQWDDIYPKREIFLNDISNESLFLAASDDQEVIMACIVLSDYQDPEYREIKWNMIEKRLR